MNPAQAILPGLESFFLPIAPRKEWTPRPHILERVKKYFLGYAAYDREIRNRRAYQAKRVGLPLGTYVRYLGWLIKTGWMKTLRRLPRLSIREVVLSSQPSENQSTGTSSETTPPITDVQNKISRETLAPENLPDRIRQVLKRAWGRIKRAKNPAAYRQSIISCEQRLMERENEMKRIGQVPVEPRVRRAMESKTESTPRIPTWTPEPEEDYTAEELEMLKEYAGR